MIFSTCYDFSAGEFSVSSFSTSFPRFIHGPSEISNNVSQNHFKITQNCSKSSIILFQLFSGTHAKLLNGSKSQSSSLLEFLVWFEVDILNCSSFLGGRVKQMIIGSAPVSGTVLNFARVVFGCEIIEAYGQTETAGG